MNLRHKTTRYLLKAIALLLTLTFAFSTFTISASAPDGSIAITPVVSLVDDTVIVDINFESGTGFGGIQSLTFQLYYDGDLLYFGSAPMIATFSWGEGMGSMIADFLFSTGGNINVPVSDISAAGTNRRDGLIWRAEFDILDAANFDIEDALDGFSVTVSDAVSQMVSFTDRVQVNDAQLAAIPPTGLTRVSAESVTLAAGLTPAATAALEVGIEPEDADMANVSVRWTSSADAVATVAAGATVGEATVTAGVAGTATVTAQLVVGTADVGDPVRFYVEVVVPQRLVARVGTRTRGALGEEVTVTFTNRSGVDYTDAYVILSVGSAVGGASFVILEDVTIANGVTDFVVGSNVFVSEGMRVSAWVLPSTPANLLIDDMVDASIAMGTQHTVGN